jgi:zinc finger BED domain-containing protein 5/7/8/9
MEVQAESAIDNKLLKASYQISYQIAKAGKSHTIGADLIKPAIVNTVSTVLNQETAQKFEALPLSATTVKRRIIKISKYLESETVRKLLLSPTFAMQLDESTDVANLAELLVYVRYVYNTTIEESMLFCKPLETTTTGLDIFNMVDSYFTENSIDWKKCSTICTDGVPALTGCHVGFVTLVKKVVDLLVLFDS